MIGDYLLEFMPEWILLTGAGLVLLLGLSKHANRGAWLQGVSLAVLLASLAAAVSRPVPDGSFHSLGLWTTSLTHYARCIALGVGLLIVLVNWQQSAPRERGEYFAMLLFSLLGILLTASANDLIVFFLAIELVSIPTYVMIALSRDDIRAAESTVKYFFLGALAAAILAYGLSFLYGAAGSTTIHQEINGRSTFLLSAVPGLSGFAMIGLLLAIGGLSFKIAAVPFHVYAPDVYEGAASPVAGLLGFVPKFAGFLALIKLFSAFQWALPMSILWLLWAVAAATMTLGNVLALLQTNVKRMLAYSSISHTGYMLIGLLVGPGATSEPMRDGIAAMLFYIAVYGAMNLGAFALLAAFQREDRDIETLDDLAGLATRAPLAALAFAVCLFSLMGLPPTAGFLGKLYLFGSAFSVSADHPFRGPLYALAILGVLNAAVGAAYYLRIVASAYVGSEGTRRLTRTGGVPVRWGLALCALPLLVFFVFPTMLSRPSRSATAVIRDILPRTPSKLTATGP